MENSREVTFYGDGARNYMVLASPARYRDNYQYRMLAVNQIHGLLTCSNRSIDNQDYLYYDITSKQSLADIFDRRQVRGSDLERLLTNLLQLEKTLTEYLLDVSHLILDPACIYADFREQEYSFAYYPGEAENTDWSSLFTFLADHVEGKDKQAAALAYRLCMMAEKPGFRLRQEVLEDLGMQLPKEKTGFMDPVFREHTGAGPGSLEREIGRETGEGRKKSEKSCRYKIFHSGALCRETAQSSCDPSENSPPRNSPQGAALASGMVGKSAEPCRNAERKQNAEWWQSMDVKENTGRKQSRDLKQNAERRPGKDRYAEQGRKDLWYMDPASGPGPDPGRYSSPERPVDHESGEEKETGGSGRGEALRRGPGAAVIALLLIAAGAGSILAGFFLELGESTVILSRAAGLVLGLAGLVLLLLQLVRKRRRGNGKVYERRNRRGQDEYEEDPFEAFLQDGYASEYPEERYSAEDASGLYGRQKDGENGDRISAARYKNASERSVYAAETTLLGADPGEQAALYGVGFCRGEQISLSSLPCVVGKMQDYVDQVLDDNSISRMHAKFSADREGKMTVRDLNSTNGTWLNGERLQPNESRVLQQGDHLRLGRMEFVFR